MMKITVSEQERGQLEGVFHTTSDARLRTRCQAVLMAHRGGTASPHRRGSGRQWADAATLAPCVSGHAPGRAQAPVAPGRRARIPAALAPEILGWILQGPAGCGLDRANCTIAELATQLYRIHGIAVSDSTMLAFCTSDGVRPYRPTDRDLKADPAPQLGVPVRCAHPRDWPVDHSPERQKNGHTYL
jgi:hypothetical protein